MWCKAGVVKERDKITPKIGDCGVTCMFWGYNINSGNNVYQMWDLDTKIIHNTRDIIWLKRIFYQDKLTTGMVAYMTQFDNWDID